MWLALMLSEMQSNRPNKLDIFKDQLEPVISACHKAKERLHQETGRGPEATTWELWICGLASMLKKHGLPASARKDSDKNSKGPSAFVVLIRELQNRIPKEYRQHIQSRDTLADSALASAINRAQRRLRVTNLVTSRS
jgi:hypothetical protein